MEQRHREILSSNRVYLTSNLDMKFIINHLTTTLTPDMEERIMNQCTNRDKVETFLKILDKRGPDAFPQFLDALTDAGFDFIRQRLEEDLDSLKSPVQETEGIVFITSSPWVLFTSVCPSFDHYFLSSVIWSHRTLGHIMFSYLSWYSPSIWCGPASGRVSFHVYPCPVTSMWYLHGLFAVCVHHIYLLSYRFVTWATSCFTFALIRISSFFVHYTLQGIAFVTKHDCF